MGFSEVSIEILSEKEFPKTFAILAEGVQQGVAPGFVAGLWRKSRPSEICLKAVGRRRLIPSHMPMVYDTVFDLASLTKIFATAPLAAVLVERGWMGWSTPVASILPTFPYPEIQIRHLLSHTAGYTAWKPLWTQLRDHFAPRPLYSVSIEKRQSWVRDALCSGAPEFAPEVAVETRATYSDLSFLVLGFALEAVTAMPLAQAVQRFVWGPMGIEGARFYPVTSSPADAIREEVAATEECSWRGGVLQGQVHDDNCWAMGGVAGHAGVFGTAKDLLFFSKRLLEGFLSPSVLKAAWTRVPRPPGCERTLGWDTPSGPESSAGHFFSTASVGHLGYTGTSLWIDPVAGLSVVLLSNRVHPSRENTKIRAFRPRFHDAIREDLSENLRHG